MTAEFLQAKNDLVDTATNGVECIKKFKESKYDMIILDIKMPNLDGHTTCKMIRNTSNIPIIFLTALSDESDQIKGFELFNTFNPISGSINQVVLSLQKFSCQL